MSNSKFSAFEQAAKAFEPLSDKDRGVLLHTLMTFFEIRVPEASASHADRKFPTTEVQKPDEKTHTIPQYSQKPDISPKEFMHKKDPRTDVEKVACLAYYLSKYRDKEYFKTIDITQLNTESAQKKLANSAYTARNAVSQGYLAHASGGQKQLSIHGEKFVQALPDREQAKSIMVAARRKNRKRSPKRVKPKLAK